MKGSFAISISNNKISYKFEIHRNLTIVRGDSATGKTTLYSMVYDYASLGKKSGVKIQCDRECTVLSLKDWEKSLKSIKDSIVFIDEGNEDISSPAFAREIKKTNNYYVFFVRENLHELPYSVEVIYRVASKGKKHWLEKIYQPNQNHILSQSHKISFETILTEDSNSGYQFFTELLKETTKDTILAYNKKTINKRYLSKENIMKIADGLNNYE